MAPNAPTAIAWRMDNMSNSQGMQPLTSVVPNGSNVQEIQIPALVLVMSGPYDASQICQILVTATLSDGTTANAVAIIELVAINTPS
jgi:hypothetical protein